MLIAHLAPEDKALKPAAGGRTLRGPVRQLAAAGGAAAAGAALPLAGRQHREAVVPGVLQNLQHCADALYPPEPHCGGCHDVFSALMAQRMRRLLPRGTGGDVVMGAGGE